MNQKKYIIPVLFLLIIGLAVIVHRIRVDRLNREPAPASTVWGTATPAGEADEPGIDPSDHAGNTAESSGTFEEKPRKKDSAFGHVIGRVTDEADNGIEGAELYIVSSTLRMLDTLTFFEKQHDGMTVSDGTYELEVSSSTPSFLIYAMHDKYSPARTKIYKIEAGERLLDVNIVMKQGGAVEGSVRNESGQGIPGARVFHIWERSWFQKTFNNMIASNIEAPEDASETDMNGRFRLEHLHDGRHTITATAEGYVSVSSPGVEVRENRTTRDVVITLEKGYVISGKVYAEADGQTVSGAEITARSLDIFNPSLKTMESDEDGSYKFDTLAEGSYKLTAKAEGFGKETKASVETGSTDVDFHLPATGSIEGRVVRKSDSTPVFGFHLSVKEPPAMMLPMYSSQFDFHVPVAENYFEEDEGWFFIDSLSPGKYRVEARAESYRPGYVDGVVVESGKTTDGVLIQLEEGVTASGRVIAKESGEPVAGADVSMDTSMEFMGIKMPDINKETIMDRTDSNGRFFLAGLPSGRVVLNAEHHEYAIAKKEIKTPDAGELNGIIIEMEQPGVIAGVVLDAFSMRGVADAEVILGESNMLTAMGMNFSGVSVSTDTDGWFEFRNLEPGTHTITVSHPDYSSKTVSDLQLFAGGSITDLEIILSSGGRIMGNVTNEQGEARSGVQVTAQSPGAMKTAHTDNQGRYEIAALVPGTYSVVLFEKTVKNPFASSSSKSCEVREGETAIVNFHAGKGGVLFGFVTRNNNPVEDAIIGAALAETSGDAYSGQGGSAMSDEQGYYEIIGLEPGYYRVTAMKDPESGMLGVYADYVQIDNNEVQHDVILPSIGITGYVFNQQDGAPQSDAEVSLASRDMQELQKAQPQLKITAMTQTDDKGYFEFTSVNPGNYSISAHKKDVGTDRISAFEVTEEGLQKSLKLYLKQDVSMHVKVLEESSDVPVPDAEISVFDMQNDKINIESVRTDAKGECDVTALPDGRYNLIAVKYGFAPGIKRNVDVSGRETTQVKIFLNEGGSLELKVRDEYKNPVPGASVTLRYAGDLPIPTFSAEEMYKHGFFGRRTDEQGHCRIARLAEGTYSITIAKKDIQNMSVLTDIIEGQATTENVIVEYELEN